MTPIKRINSWFNVVKQSFFTYKDGFFQISYLSNSPQMIIDSCMKMPFVKFNKTSQTFYSDNMFIDFKLSYAELEEGLWIMYNDFYYKNNIVYEPFYDKHSPSTFYYLTINKIENEFKSHYYELENYKIHNYSITLVKPEKKFLFSHFKGSKEKVVIFLIDEAWLQKNIINSSLVNDRIKNVLTNKTVEYINYHFELGHFEENLNNFITIFNEFTVPNIFQLKKLTYEFFELFFNLVMEKDSENDSKEFYNLNKEDIQKVERIEQFLISDLFSKFCGIVFLAKKFKISPTKLKHDFKLVYGLSIFKYFQHKQMVLALKYLNENDLSIKELAQKFGYENVSKFSNTFKKHNAMLPSKFIK